MAIDRAAALRNAEKLLRQGKLDPAIAEYESIVEEQPADWTTRNTLGDLYVRAGQSERAASEYTRIADAFKDDGFLSKAAALYRKILKIKPNDEHSLLQGAEIAVAQGLLLDAKSGMATVIEQRRARGDVSGALTLVARLGTVDPADIDARLVGARAHGDLGDADAATRTFVGIADDLIEQRQANRAVDILREATVLSPEDTGVRDRLLRALIGSERIDEARALVMTTVDDASRRSDWGTAAAACESLLVHAPQDVPMLARLVEVAVDGALDDRLLAAQGRLADAYPAGGALTEARLIAEDLMARRPDDASHEHRLRRVLVAAGHEDVDEVIAEYRSRPADAEETLPEQPMAPIAGTPAQEVSSREPLPPVMPMPAVAVDRPRETVVAQVQHRSRHVEVDLSVVLDQIHKPPAAPPTLELDDVFAQMREEARRVAIDSAEQDYRRGVALFQAGQIDDSVVALESASRTPRFRFETASLLGRIFLNRGDLTRAIEWLDRAAEAPAPTDEEHYRVLYNLSDALESAGDTVRALAVSLELQSEAGAFRDVAAKIHRLAKAQSRG